MKKSKKVLAVCMASAMATQMGMVASNADVENVKKESLLDKATRISGADRYETANKISQKFNSAETVIIASGINFPDALCAAPLAKKTNSPILLSKKDMLISNTIKEIKRLKSKKAIIVGGESSIGKNVEKQLTDNGLIVTRISGSDRYETSVEIAKHLPKSNEVALASGAGFADALSISEVAAQKQMPILLSSKDKVPTRVDKFINDVGASKTYIVGGESTLSKNIISQVPGAKRLAGADRYKTNAVVNNQFKSMLDFENVYVASGKTFPDALSGAPLAARHAGPLVLVGNNLDSKVKTLLEDNMKTDTEVTIFGGENSISNEVANKVVDCIPSSGGGGGGGGYVEKPTIVKNASELKTAIENTSITKIDLDSTYDSTENIDATRGGSGNLTINFKDSQTINSLTINSPELENLTLNDSGAGDLGAKIDTLTINAPKAHVINNVQTRVLNIEAVSSTTLVAKDKVTENVNMKGKGTLEVSGTNNVKKVNVGPRATGAKITGDGVESVEAQSSIEINVPVTNVSVPTGVIGVQLSGSGNLENVKTDSPVVLKSTGTITKLEPKADVILDANATNVEIPNNPGVLVNISGNGKINALKANGKASLSMKQKVDTVENTAPLTLNSPAGVVTPKTNIPITINSEVENVAINAVGAGSIINGSGLVKKVTAKAPVVLNTTVRNVDVPSGAMGASIDGSGNIGTVTTREALALNAQVQQVEVPNDAGVVSIFSMNIIPKVVTEKTVILNSPVENVEVPTGATGVEIQGVGMINNVDASESILIKNLNVIAVTAYAPITIKTELPFHIQTYKTVDVQGNVMLNSGGALLPVTQIKVKEPVINLSLDESDEGISPNPNEDNFEDVKFTLNQEAGVTYYYTLDGTDPTVISNQYNGEVNIDAGTSYDKKVVTIKVIGVRVGDTNSSVVSQSVVFAKYNKKDPTYTTITAGDVKYGKTLNTASISGDFNVPGTVFWDNGNYVVNTAGSYIWKFIPNDTDKYNIIIGYKEIGVDYTDEVNAAKANVINSLTDFSNTINNQAPNTNPKNKLTTTVNGQTIDLEFSREAAAMPNVDDALAGTGTKTAFENFKNNQYVKTLSANGKSINIKTATETEIVKFVKNNIVKDDKINDVIGQQRNMTLNCAVDINGHIENFDVDVTFDFKYNNQNSVEYIFEQSVAGDVKYSKVMNTTDNKKLADITYDKNTNKIDLTIMSDYKNSPRSVLVDTDIVDNLMSLGVDEVTIGSEKFDITDGQVTTLRNMAIAAVGNITTLDDLNGKNVIFSGKVTNSGGYKNIDFTANFTVQN